MGKQRYWSGHGTTKTTPSSSIKRVFKNDLDNEASSSSSSSSSSTSAGCMCAVFQLFDFHPLNHLSSQSSASLNQQSDHRVSKGSSFASKLENIGFWTMGCLPKFDFDELRYVKFQVLKHHGTVWNRRKNYMFLIHCQVRLQRRKKIKMLYIFQ